MFRPLQRDPKQLVERGQTMSEAIADYPLYDPPYRQGSTYLRRRPNQSAEEHAALFSEFIQRGRENLSYLLEQRSTRLAALRDFLAKFGVQTGLEDAGLASVSGWCPENCGALVADFRDTATLRMFFQMQTPWMNQWRGLNVVFDLGFYLGECLIVRNQNLHWAYRSGLSEDGMSALSGNFIEGFKSLKKGNWLDPMQFIYSRCGTDQMFLRGKRKIRIVRSETLVGKVRDFSTR